MLIADDDPLSRTLLTRLLRQKLDECQRLEAIGRAAAALAHELGDAVTVLCGYSEMLVTRTDATHEERRKWLQHITASSELANTLTHRLLSLEPMRPSHAPQGQAQAAEPFESASGTVQ